MQQMCAKCFKNFPQGRGRSPLWPSRGSAIGGRSDGNRVETARSALPEPGGGRSSMGGAGGESEDEEIRKNGEDGRSRFWAWATVEAGGGRVGGALGGTRKTSIDHQEGSRRATDILIRPMNAD